ncbi:Com family DNA-binding transcriptional regulator [Mycobacterium sp. KBS0706]|uniref:Com family DNA-binding transcriptional regulator n=1 Tax=Mycobacterium sp. KBS0706 TaxID=2578109 RepID=UPI00110F9A3F|nr:Com family DNA-binding transcriptional regulator [Mycobacterium sp. KBS0706]
MRESSRFVDLRCRCGRLLCRAEPGRGIEIKCPRCRTLIRVIPAESPPPERPGASTRTLHGEETRAPSGAGGAVRPAGR